MTLSLGLRWYRPGQVQNTTADPPFGFAQGRLFGDDNQKSNCNGKGVRKSGGLVWVDFFGILHCVQDDGKNMRQKQRQQQQQRQPQIPHSASLSAGSSGMTTRKQERRQKVFGGGKRANVKGD
jgi:hypothetical protein